MAVLLCLGLLILDHVRPIACSKIHHSNQLEGTTNIILETLTNLFFFRDVSKLHSYVFPIKMAFSSGREILWCTKYICFYLFSCQFMHIVLYFLCFNVNTVAMLMVYNYYIFIEYTVPQIIYNV